MLIDTSASVYNLPVKHIASYLQLQGWKLAHENSRWLVFHGRKSAGGDPFEIVLPKDIDESDYPFYVRHAINILASLDRLTPETIANDVLRYDRDLLNVRVVESVDKTSIPFDMAAKYISELKQLVRFAASSESNAKPNFDQPLSAAAKMMRHFRFGHTFAGSFGYSIEAPVGEPKRFRTKPMQLELPLKEKDILIIPIQRRIMERIARGLRATEKALNSQETQPLIDGYAEGFNANMCDAIRKMVEGQSEDTELSIIWSKKIEASDGIKQVKNVRIGQRHVKYLEAASYRLKALEPEFKTITGRVIALSSDGDPLSDNAVERTVVVQWERTNRRSRKVRMNLSKNDYILADEAHMNWDTISVKGIMQKKGSIWQLSDPEAFTILNFSRE
ncbi:MAG: hypothetical protein OXN94_15245 [Chloroflexota bacterium]|nr:hypothetical protein [Chloroflexota bacterium]